MTSQEQTEENPLCLTTDQWELDPKTGVINIKESSFKSLINSKSLEDVYAVDSNPIARGQFAMVYHCTHRLTGKEFAAKFSSLFRHGDCCERDIIHEIAVSAMLRQCCRAVHLVDIFQTEKEMILLMEYAPGGDLQTLLDEEMVPYEKDVIKFMRQLLEGLVYIHERNIVHLDIKPQNVVLMGEFPDCAVKLCDFEISRLVSKEDEVREILGTPDYVAPEILLYEPITTKTDMWSVGVLTYVLLTGFLPFGGENDQETFMEILKCDVDFPPELFEDVTSDAIDFIRKLLVKNPEQRLSAKDSLNHVWLNNHLSQPNQSSTLDLNSSAIQEELKTPPIIISDVSSSSASKVLTGPSFYSADNILLENSEGRNISSKCKVTGRPPIHPFSTQKSLVGETNSCNSPPMNAPCESGSFSSSYTYDSKLGSRHNLERMRSMSKSRDVISGRVQMSNLKKCLSKSRERLCETRFGASKSREQLMLLNSLSKSVEALSQLTKQNSCQSQSNIFLPKFYLPHSTGNSQDRMYQSMAAIDQIGNMNYFKGKGFFESSISLINPSCSHISVHLNSGLNFSTGLKQHEKPGNMKSTFGLRGNSCRGGRTGSTDSCNSRYMRQRQAETKNTQRNPKINKSKKINHDTQKRRKEKDRQEKVKEKRKNRSSEMPKINNTENDGKMKRNNSSSPQFRRGSVCHVEQRLQERHVRNLERQEKLLMEEKRNKRKTSVDDSKPRTKSYLFLHTTKERTRSLTPTRRLNKNDSITDSDVSQASSLESVSMSGKSSMSDIAEIWNRHKTGFKKSLSDSNNNKDYIFVSDESTESDEAYASLEEVPHSSSTNKNIKKVAIKESPSNNKSRINQLTSPSNEESNAEMSVSEKINHFEKNLIGGLKRSKSEVNNWMISDRCICETKELPVITEEPSSISSLPRCLSSGLSTSDSGSIISGISDDSTEKDNFSPTVGLSESQRSLDWKIRSKSFSTNTSVEENPLLKSRSNSFNLDLLDNDLARPWGNVCNGAVARAFEKFKIKPAIERSKQCFNVTSNSIKLDSILRPIKT